MDTQDMDRNIRETLEELHDEIERLDDYALDLYEKIHDVYGKVVYVKSMYEDLMNFKMTNGEL